MNLSDAYRLLDIAPGADESQLKRAYRKAMRRTHPDAGGSAAQFTAVKDAYELILSDKKNVSDVSTRNGGATFVGETSATPFRTKQSAPTPAQIIGPHPQSLLVSQFSHGEPFQTSFLGSFSSTKKNQATAEQFVLNSLVKRIPRSLPAARLFNGVSLGRKQRLPQLLVSGYRAVVMVPVLVPDQRYRHNAGELIGPNQPLPPTNIAELRKEFEKRFPRLNTIAMTVAVTSALDSYRPAVTASEKSTAQEIVSAANVGTAIADAIVFLGSGPQHNVVDTDVLAKVSQLLS